MGIVSIKPKNIEFTVLFGFFVVAIETKMELKRIRKCFEAYLQSRPVLSGTGGNMCLKWSLFSHALAVLLLLKGKDLVQLVEMHESA